jgi:hypothetical protein
VQLSRSVAVKLSVSLDQEDLTKRSLPLLFSPVHVEGELSSFSEDGDDDEKVSSEPKEI